MAQGKVLLGMERPVGPNKASGPGRGTVRWRRLGEILTVQRVITRAELSSALAQQADLTGAGRSYPIGRVLISMGVATPAEIEAALARQASHAARRRGSEPAGGGTPC